MKFSEGIWAINKIKGVSSFDVIGFLRNKTGVKKIGHAGTLDPLASGVLVVAIGREYTKKISEYVKKEKEYEAEMNLASFSSTDDAEGEKTRVVIDVVPSFSQIKKTILEFIGEIEQTPPPYSAIKIKGKPAYKLARASKEFEIKPRKVMIKQVEILDYKFPSLKIRVVCGSGTYIRSLARDLGKKLKTGGYITGLIRTRVGEFGIKDSINLDMEIRKKDRLKM